MDTQQESSSKNMNQMCLNEDIHRFEKVNNTDPKFSDVTFIVGNDVYRLHMVVLASCSPYFAGMFSNCWLESPHLLAPLESGNARNDVIDADDSSTSQAVEVAAVGGANIYGIRSKEIRLNNVNSECMGHLFTYIYTGKTEGLNNRNLLAVLFHADQFLVQPLKIHCYRQLAGRMCPENCLMVWRFARNLGHRWLEKVARRFVLRNFKIVAELPGFLDLEYNALEMLLNDDRLNAPCEEMVFEAVVLWLQRRRVRDDVIASNGRVDEVKAGNGQVDGVKAGNGQVDGVKVNNSQKDGGKPGNDHVGGEVGDHVGVEDVGNRCGGEASPNSVQPNIDSTSSSSSSPSSSSSSQTPPNCKRAKEAHVGGVKQDGDVRRTSIRTLAPFRIKGKPEAGLVRVDLEEVRWMVRSCRLANMHSDFIHEQVLGFCIHVAGSEHELIDDIVDYITATFDHVTKSYPLNRSNILAESGVYNNAPYSMCQLHTQLRPRLPYQVILVIGGLCRGNQITTCMESYDPRSNRWLNVRHNPPPPVVDPAAHNHHSPLTQDRRLPIRFTRCHQVSHHGAVCVDNMVYLIGGFDGVKYFDSCVRYDPALDEWQIMQHMFMARCYLTVCELDGIIYSLGGFNRRNRQNSAEAYSIATDRWNKLPPMLYRRSDACSSAYKGKVYVAGGYNGSNVLNHVEAYDTISQQWTMLNRMDYCRTGASMVRFREYLYVFGGSEGLSTLNTCERFNIQSGHWTTFGQMLIPRNNLSVALAEDCIYIMGGFNGRNHLANVEVYYPLLDVWSTSGDMLTGRSSSVALVLDDIDNVEKFSYIGQTLPVPIPVNESVNLLGPLDLTIERVP